MNFNEKANYSGHYDKNGIPMLDYQGSIGLQYNPIAISQWGLGNYNLWHETKSTIFFEKFIKSANWLIENLEENKYGLKVWMHYFDFEYMSRLKSPWYSGLAQGQGISVLLRAFKETNNNKYKIAAKETFQSFLYNTNDGGVNYKDSDGDNWIEEYIVFPPTHILNGFIWSLWGIYDYALFFNDKKVAKQFKNYSNTIIKNLNKYDIGYWSKYEQTKKSLPMIASEFYHKLHIVQLEIMYDLTGEKIFLEFNHKWKKYLNNYFFKVISFFHKAIFKVLYY